MSRDIVPSARLLIHLDTSVAALVNNLGPVTRLVAPPSFLSSGARDVLDSP